MSAGDRHPMKYGKVYFGCDSQTGEIYWFSQDNMDKTQITKERAKNSNFDIYSLELAMEESEHGSKFQVRYIHARGSSIYLTELSDQALTTVVNSINLYYEKHLKIEPQNIAIGQTARDYRGELLTEILG